MIEEADIEDVKFEKLLEDRRFRELKAVLKVIADKDNKDVIDAIQDSKELVEKFAEAIKKLPEPKVNVTVNNDKSEASIKKLGLDILKGLDEVKDLLIMANQPKEVIFTVKRHNYTHYIESVTAKEIISTPKYQA